MAALQYYRLSSHIIWLHTLETLSSLCVPFIQTIKQGSLPNTDITMWVRRDHITIIKKKKSAGPITHIWNCARVKRWQCNSLMPWYLRSARGLLYPSTFNVYSLEQTSHPFLFPCPPICCIHLSGGHIFNSVTGVLTGVWSSALSWCKVANTDESRHVSPSIVW